MTIQPDGYQPAQGPASPTPQIPQIPQTPPTAAGGARIFRLRLTKVTSVILITQQRRTNYTGTLAQLENTARSVLVYNLLLGWWGIPFGLIWTPMALVRNAKALKQLRALAAAPN